MGGADAGYFCVRGLARGFGVGGVVNFGCRRRGVFGDLGDDVVRVAELYAFRVADGGVEGAENKFGAFDFDGAAKQGVDDFHEGGLDGFLVLKEGGVVDAGAGRTFDGTEHALVEIAELLSAEWGRAAADSGDFDMSARLEIWHIGPLDNFFVVSS
jgi:hypothetical protein